MKKAILFFGLVVLIGVGFGYYQYNKPATGVKSMKSDFALSSADLFTEFESNENSANQKYLDKVIEVSGTIQSISEEEGKTTITLDGGMMFGIICNMDDTITNASNQYQKGQKVNLKGICTGMLMDVVLIRCIEIN